MADSPILPGSHAHLVGSDGKPTREFYSFFRDLVRFVTQTQGNSAALTDILARLDALEAASASDVVGQHSVQVIQQEAQTLVRLVGDLSSPAAASYYGAGADGAKGWFQRLLATLADVDLTGLADGDALVWDATAARFVPGQMSGGGVLPVVTGEISGGQPVFVYGPDGSLIYGPI